MPSILDHQSNETTKLLFLGNSGTGKSGALASLAALGYRLRILDMDNGLDVLRHLLMDRSGIYARSPHANQYGKNIHYVTLIDKRTIALDAQKKPTGRLVPTARAWSRASEMLQGWKEGDVDFGPITTWTSQDILVVDSFTGLSDCAFRHILGINGRLGVRPYESDYGEAQQLLRNFLEIVIDPEVKCNVILNCHIKYLGKEGEGGDLQGYPSSIGKALSPDIGRYFNTALLAQVYGQGAQATRKIYTVPAANVGVKTTVPLRAGKEYPLATGLAEYFCAVRGQAVPDFLRTGGGDKK